MYLSVNMSYKIIMLNIGTCVNYFCSSNLLDDMNPTSKPISVTFCILGNNYSPGFFLSWTKFLFYLKENPNLITPHFSNNFDEDTCAMKNNILGGLSSKGFHQTPFEDDFDCDLVFWINCEMIFEPVQILQIVYKMAKRDLEILTGVYFKNENLNLIENDKNLSFFTKEKLIEKAMQDEDRVCEIDNTYLDFVCIKNQLYKHIKYPWFEKSDLHEDLAFFRKLKENKSIIYCDATIFVNRDKK